MDLYECGLCEFETTESKRRVWRHVAAAHASDLRDLRAFARAE